MRRLKKFMELRFTVEDDKAREHLGGIGNRIRLLFSDIPEDIGEDVGRHMKKSILEAFEAEGPGWAPLSRAYARWKERHFPGMPIGQRTRQLITSIDWRNQGGQIVAGSLPNSGRSRNPASSFISALYKKRIERSETGKHKGLKELPPVETYAGEFNRLRPFTVLSMEREYAIRKTVWYWIVNGEVRPGEFGRDV